MDHSVAQVEANTAGGPRATTALTPSRQLLEDVFMNPQQERLSTPSPMAPASADMALRLEIAQLRAELSLIRRQIMKN